MSLTEALFAAGIGEIEDCRYEAALLLEHFCGVKRAALPLCRDKSFTDEALLNAVERRCKREPLQYIIGEWYFCNEVYTVTPSCLIPRMDTEILVETAASLLQPEGRFLDLCTGSGCIAVSLLSARKDSSGVAVDLYPDTLRVAEGNAARNGVSDRFTPVLGDVLRGDFMETLGQFDLIISNPPYIPSKVVDGLSPEVLNEPRAALDGGDDGLVFYRVLIQDYPRFLKKGGKMILEIGYDQRDAVSALAKAEGHAVEVLKDLGGNDRMAIITPV